ncbi:uncharacterized protein LOC114125384 [Aphis gossypii]|uniref:Uncharacterized protein n=1 Tax=Aphis gossypii TaxID=80765 RepID=A0A9P0NC43_APHGO|nr:uncharacterized protein LOC114125384 [Aphis gossypii]CAH1716221.1 unnamed protein product [Aphis gossypii]
MPIMILGLSGSRATSDPSLPLMFLLILLPLTYSYSINVLESESENAQFMEKLPVTYQENLELLDTVLALEEQWSPVWSEELHLEELLEEEKLVNEFCPLTFEYGETVNTLNYIKWVKKHCSHSGMHVAFAVKLLGYSVKCLFYKNAIAQFTSIKNLKKEDSQFTEYDTHLQHLIDDSHMFADRMASVHVSLVDLIEWTKTYEELKKLLNDYKLMPEDKQFQSRKKKKFLDGITKTASKIVEDVEEKLDSLCSVPAKINWYDFENKKSVELFIDREKISEEEIKEVSKEGITVPTDQSSSSDLPVEYVLTDPILKKADELRKMFHKIFDKLLLGKLPLEVWELVFQNYILVYSN